MLWVLIRSTSVHVSKKIIVLLHIENICCEYSLEVPKQVYPKKYFSYFFLNIYVVGSH